MNERASGEIIVAYQGPRGTFGEQAAKKYFVKATFVPYPGIADIFNSIEEGDADYGIVPIENSTEGSISITLDCLLESHIMICGEVDLKITHNLIARQNINLDQITVILSHPQALAQCRQFLEKTFPRIELREISSTAKAVELLRDIDHGAAIGTEDAAERVGMVILKKQIEDDPNNLTRFFILGRSDAKPTGSDKTSVVFSTKHVPGALYRVLKIFATKNINFSIIESRPDKK